MMRSFRYDARLVYYGRAQASGRIHWYLHRRFTSVTTTLPDPATHGDWKRLYDDNPYGPSFMRVDPKTGEVTYLHPGAVERTCKDPRAPQGLIFTGWYGIPRYWREPDVRPAEECPECGTERVFDLTCDGYWCPSCDDVEGGSNE